MMMAGREQHEHGAEEPGRAQVIGLGVIGGSVAQALRNRGWYVTGDDARPGRADEAVERGVIDASGIDPMASLTFVATPVSSIASIAREALDRGGVVTDVGSVKSSVVGAMAHPRFVGGHPMAGSERSGLDGVNPDLFDGATWVLTPGAQSDPDAYMAVRNVVLSFGAEVMTLDPAQHDELVATISHVPHLAAMALMHLALERASSQEPVMRLAATGFRDMTRIAAGPSDVWVDIALDNDAAIVGNLDRLITVLGETRDLIANRDRAHLHKVLDEASVARRDLPLRVGRPADLTQLSVVIPDRPGALGSVLGVFGEVQVNVEDLDINHAIEGGRGTLLLTVAADQAEQVSVALKAHGLRVTAAAL